MRAIKQIRETERGMRVQERTWVSKARYRWLKKQLGYVDEADDSTIRRLVSEGKRLYDPLGS